MSDAVVEQIEAELEQEIGWRWTPQMHRDGHKALKLWQRLVKARVEIKLLRAGVSAAEHLLLAANGPDGGPTDWNETRQWWLGEFGKWEAAEAKEKSDG